MPEAAPSPAATFVSSYELMQAFVVPLQEGETLESVSFDEIGARMEEQLAPLAERMGALAAESAEPRIVYSFYDPELKLSDVGLQDFESDAKTGPASLDFLKYALAEPVFETTNREEFDAFMLVQQQRDIIERATAKGEEDDDEDDDGAEAQHVRAELDAFLAALFAKELVRS